MTMERYLNAYHEESEAKRRELALMLGRGDNDQALATLAAWDKRVDDLWAQVETPA